MTIRGGGVALKTSLTSSIHQVQRGPPKASPSSIEIPLIFLHWAKTVFIPPGLAGVFGATSICFDLSVFELFVPLCWGGKVVLADSVLSLLEMSAKHEISLVNTVPSAMSALLSAGPLPPSVRTVNLAGEPLERNW